ncbi:hypothetical protein CR513_25042, partial [Mucuna pruriens]
EEQQNYVRDPPKRTLQDYFIPTIEVTNNILRPLVGANNFKLSEKLKINNVPTNTIGLGLFLFSLADRALECFMSFPNGSITAWDKCAHKFMLIYFPPSKTNKPKKDIINFSQFEQELLYEAWERF